MRQPSETHVVLHTCSTTVPETLPCSSLSLQCVTPVAASRTYWGRGLIWTDPHDWLTAAGMAQWETAPHCTAVTALAANLAEERTATLLKDNSLYMAIKTFLYTWWLQYRTSNPTAGLDRPWWFQEVEAPRFQDNRYMKVVSCQPYTLAAFTTRKYSWYSFLLETESTPGP
jgi:hypothetical protein